MTKAIYFDMDGTIANLYAVDNWLPKLRAYDPSPYMDATPMLRLCSLAKRLNRLQKKWQWKMVIMPLKRMFSMTKTITTKSMTDSFLETLTMKCFLMVRRTENPM